MSANGRKTILGLHKFSKSTPERDGGGGNGYQWRLLRTNGD